MPRLRRLQDAGVFVSVDNFAYIAANQGRLDEAFLKLEEALSWRMTNVLWLAVDPWADPLRSDPRLDQCHRANGCVQEVTRRPGRPPTATGRVVKRGLRSIRADSSA